MVARFTSSALQVTGYFLEIGLILFLVWRGHWKRLASPLVYLMCFLVAGGLRTWALYRYGLTSPRYGYVYWVTDIVLVLAAFAVVCVFFRRACHEESRMWPLLRLALPVIFFLVVGLSALSLSRHYSHLFTLFIVEFSENLYFTCLVLTTLLYVLLQQLRSVDGELGLLVSGLGIQFAGPAASMALFQLTGGGSFARSLTAHVVPLCTWGCWWSGSMPSPNCPRVRPSRPKAGPGPTYKR